MTVSRRIFIFLVDGTHADTRAAIGGCVGFIGGLATSGPHSANIFEFGWHTGTLALIGSLGGVFIAPIGITSGICGLTYGLTQLIRNRCCTKYCRRNYNQREY